jgi:hypothetical protein
MTSTIFFILSLVLLFFQLILFFWLMASLPGISPHKIWDAAIKGNTKARYCIGFGFCAILSAVISAFI